MRAEFIYNSASVGEHAHCGSLLQLSNGDLCCAWYAYTGGYDYRNGQIAFARSYDQGQHWSEGESVFGRFNASAGNPIIFQERLSGRLWMLFVLLQGDYWNDAVLHMSHSDNNGFNWAKPQQLSPKRGLMVRHAPIELEDATFLIPAYDECSNTSLFFSFKEGTLELLSEVSQVKAIQPVLVRNAGGVITALLRPSSEPRVIWRASSNNLGRDWSMCIQTVLPCPLAGIGAFSIGDKLCAVFNNSRTKRSDLSISLSTDRGVRWNEPLLLDSSKHEVSYPSFLVDSEGYICGVFTFNRRMLRFVRLGQSELYNGV
ncbi:MAG: exo-alpha-sialidase [Bdellovibrionales bacterium]|nr:exo-alpha-sialidase [Bdellovibrionales bacterium]